MLKRIQNKIIAFSKSNKNRPKLVALASGLYPFLHYYNSNLSIADSFEQLFFLVIICFLLPQILIGFSPFVVKLLKLQSLEKYRLTQLNLGVFISLLIVLILHLNRYYSLLVLIVFIIGGFLLHKHLKKIIVLQFILALMSFIMLIPKLYFAANQNNSSWTKISDSVLNVKLQKKPNIFVIQPDGYVNVSQINEEPYSFDNSKFENWLTDNSFINYSNFRSNYYSTLTSNASMFAMKHHYYSNTSKQAKTHKALDVIVGEENNVLKILKNNNYRSYLLTDNSFFLINRKPLYYDFCNISMDKISYYDTGGIEGVDIIQDFSRILDTIPKHENFFFIEKTTPSHIMHKKRFSNGVEQERIKYLQRLQFTNSWLQKLVISIKKFDEDAMIIIVADHGGFVGLEYVLEVLNRELTSVEVVSAFSSMLSIKWPQNVDHSKLKFKSNVNLFRGVFYSLSNEKSLLNSEESNTSYIPLRGSWGIDYYRCINENGYVDYQKISD